MQGEKEGGKNKPLSPQGVCVDTGEFEAAHRLSEGHGQKHYKTILSYRRALKHILRVFWFPQRY